MTCNHLVLLTHAMNLTTTLDTRLEYERRIDRWWLRDTAEGDAALPKAWIDRAITCCVAAVLLEHVK